MPKSTQSQIAKVEIKQDILCYHRWFIVAACNGCRESFAELDPFRAAGSVVKCASDGRRSLERLSRGSSWRRERR